MYINPNGKEFLPPENQTEKQITNCLTFPPEVGAF